MVALVKASSGEIFNDNDGKEHSDSHVPYELRRFQLSRPFESSVVVWKIQNRHVYTRYLYW
ncbi:hypothetical protein JG687_00018545 [Phytophthora cactorum]|uniref:Uncharacterized protein n=1 Tax=Phytophthora cactorum TaxID=29920 RepID=A0A8T1TMG9_9STRA|nr:hypothetical protein JG687_00018545 [Phytophthora cactorum]